MRTHLTYANVMATIAVFIALGGVSYAAVVLPKNSVGASQIKRNAVASPEIARGAVGSSEVGDGSLLADDFKPGELPRGPRGATGERGEEGAAGIQGPQGTRGAEGPAGPQAQIGDDSLTGQQILESSLGPVPTADKLSGIRTDTLVTTGSSAGFSDGVLEVDAQIIPAGQDRLVHAAPGGIKYYCPSDPVNTNGSLEFQATRSFTDLFVDTGESNPTHTRLNELQLKYIPMARDGERITLQVLHLDSRFPAGDALATHEVTSVHLPGNPGLTGPRCLVLARNTTNRGTFTP